MKALAITDFDSSPEVLDLPVPDVAPGDVRVRVVAAGLNKVDTMIAAGALRGFAEYAFPVVLGRDAAGIVDAVGADVTAPAVGDEVILNVPMDGTLRHGTLAEFAVVPSTSVVRKPQGIAFDAAAALPLAAAAATGAVDAVGPGDGSTVLISGATGGVGSYAIQLARARGATVVATGRAADAGRLEALGAGLVVDYGRDVAEQVRAAHPGGVDALIELVSWDPAGVLALAELVRDGGHVVSALGAADANALGERGIGATNLAADTSAAMLSRLVGAVERGELNIDLQRVLPLSEAAAGLGLLGGGGARGKIVVAVASRA